jgi:hypothetical protein
MPHMRVCLSAIGIDLVKSPVLCQRWCEYWGHIMARERKKTGVHTPEKDATDGKWGCASWPLTH